MDRNQLYGNASKRAFSIPRNILLGGYIDRADGNTGTHDELYTRCLALYDGKVTIAIISNDLLEIDREITEIVRKGLNEKIGITHENVMVCSTHTHSGPAVTQWDFSFKQYVESKEIKKLKYEITNTIIENAIQCISELKPAVIGYAKAECSEVTGNRVVENGISDPSIGTIIIKDMNEQVISLIVNYACHPTILGADNMHVSGDFPGALMKKLDKYFKNCTSLFINGACGNQSTRFNRRGQSFDEVERIAQLLYDKVIDSLSKTDFSSQHTIVLSKLEEIIFPVRKFPTRKQLIQNYEDAEKNKNETLKSSMSMGEKRLAITKCQGAKISLNLLETLEGRKYLKSEVQIFRIGNIEVIGIPLELFMEYGMEIKDKSLSSNVVLACYANEVLGYLCTEDAVLMGGYEAYASPFSPEAGYVLVGKVLEMEKTLFL